MGADAFANAAVRPLERRRVQRPRPRVHSEPALRLTLFTAASAPGLRCLRALDEVLRRLGDRALSLEVCDVARWPDRAERAGIVFTPVLRVECAGRAPLTIFGALDDPDTLLKRLARAGLSVEDEEAGRAGGAAGAGPFSAGGPRGGTG